jgi:hypothetical protein
MARIGYLLLHEGRWNGKQVVPSDYVREAATTRESARFPAGDPPRLPLSVLDTPATGIVAVGFGGQSVVVFLKLDLVIVTKGAIADIPPAGPFELIGELAEAGTARSRS